jgi:hypothetical protein
MNWFHIIYIIHILKLYNFIIVNMSFQIIKKYSFRKFKLFLLQFVVNFRIPNIYQLILLNI